MTALGITCRLITVLVAVALGACGLPNPYQSTTTRSTTTTAATTATAPGDQRDPAPERGGTSPTTAEAAQNKPAAGAARPSPQAALERYAATYLNWDAAHVIAIQRQLASISLGQARAQALQAAASASRDSQLTNSDVANHGHVVAISPGQTTATGRWVIVTSERTGGHGDYQDLPPTLHIIYAQLTNTSQGWVVSRWQPQN
jgi:hypothetical protein